MKVRERFAFWRQFRNQFQTTGALQPSSRFLARAMTEPLRNRRTAAPETSLRIVEMGPGTGAVTRAIAAAMGPEDTLACYEINAEFAAYLRRSIASRPEYRRVANQITVHCRAAQEAAAEEPLDLVICSVPLNNLPGAVVTQIFDAGFGMLKSNGSFTYFEYPCLPSLRRLAASAGERARIDEVSRAKARVRDRLDASHVVILNLPPARAVHLRAG